MDAAVDRFLDYLRVERGRCHRVFHALQKVKRPFLLRSELLDSFEALCREKEGEGLEETPLASVISWSQEAAVKAPWLYFAVRPRVGEWSYLQVHMETMATCLVNTADYLQFKERLIDGDGAGERWVLEPRRDGYVIARPDFWH